MEVGKITRKRAVQLKAEALILLNDALIAAWQKDSDKGKLTRDEKAKLLGVSLATSERILKGRGVDRPSLTLAFKNVGLAWSDDYCEYVVENDAVVLDLPTIEHNSEPTEHFRVSRSRLAFLAVVVIVLIGAFVLPSIYAREPEDDWSPRFNQKMSDVERAYFGAHYDRARTLADQAIEMARNEGRAGPLAGALRMIGDLEATAGNFSAAKERYEEAIAIRRGLNHLQNLPPIQEALGNTLTKMGDLGTAHHVYMESLAGFEVQNDVVGIAMATRGLGYLELERNRLDQALKWSEKSIAAARTAQKRAIEMDAWACIALVKRDQGQLTEAESILADCLKYWSREKHPRWVAKMRMLLATVKLKRGERSEAIAMLEESRAEYSAIGAKEGVAQCNELLLQEAKATVP